MREEVVVSRTCEAVMIPSGEKVRLTIPKGAEEGQKVRLKGRGVPGRGGKASGDQYVRLKIVLPEKPDPKLAEDRMRTLLRLYGVTP